MTQLLRAIRAGCLIALCVIGCSTARSRVELNKEEQAIVNVGLAYRDASNVLKRGPANEMELKPYLKQYGDPDQLLISPNDGQPYHIIWGLTPSRPTKSAFEQRFLVYEKTGKDGKRYAVDIMLKVHHLNAEEFTNLQERN
jgi:hypothetical protein